MEEHLFTLAGITAVVAGIVMLFAVRVIRPPKEGTGRVAALGAVSFGTAFSAVILWAFLFELPQ
jgi:hypothetical protein